MQLISVAFLANLTRLNKIYKHEGLRSSCGNHIVLVYFNMSLNTRISELEKTIKQLVQDVLQTGDDGIQRQLHSIVQEQAAVLESPLQVFMRMMMEPLMNACLRVAQELKIVDILSEETKCRTAAELADLSKADKLLIGWFPYS
jgi:hypothetical protein